MVRIPTPLRSYTGGASEVAAEGATLAELLLDLDRRHPGLRFRVVDEQGRLRQHMRIFVNRSMGHATWTTRSVPRTRSSSCRPCPAAERSVSRMAQTPLTVDDYIASFPPEVAAVLEAVRRTIDGVVPGAGEKISYQMPTVTIDGRALCYDAAWKRHLGIYPVPPLDAELEAEVAPYRAAKDTVRIPYTEPVPLDLIGRVVASLLASHRQ